MAFFKTEFIYPKKGYFPIFLLPVIGYEYDKEKEDKNFIGLVFICFGIIIKW